MALTEAQAAQACNACAADPKAAPGRYCSRYRCLCGHEECHAFASYIPRRPVLKLVRASKEVPHS